jgi:hypothetical protein
MKRRSPFPDVEETDPEALGVALLDNEPDTFWVENVTPELMRNTRFGMLVKTKDGRTIKVTAMDVDRGRVRFEVQGERSMGRDLARAMATEADRARARGLLPSNSENRKARRAGVATWVPPVEPAQGFEVKDISPERMKELHVGKVVNAPDGTRAEVVWLDPEQGRARYQFVTERMPTRRELLLQRKRRARGPLDVKTRRLARARLRKEA